MYSLNNPMSDIPTSDIPTSDSPIPVSPIPSSDMTFLGTITVRRSMRIANKKRINYDGMVLDSERKKSSKETVRDILKMEISPIRHLKNLTIEARHTLSLQESKKKRLQFEKSLFLPNNKKRKDVLSTFNKKSFILKNNSEERNTLIVNSTEFNHSALNQSDETNFSSENSEQSYRSSMKRNHFASKDKCNEEEFVSSAEKEKVSSEETSEKMSFPSYVAYRTKGNKLKLVQSKVDQNFSIPCTIRERLQLRGLLKPTTSLSVTEKPESTTKSDESENPSVSHCNNSELKGQICTSLQKCVFSPDTLIDLTINSPTIETPIDLTQSVRSQSEVILGDSSQVVPHQPASTSAINISPCLPSTSSNSMEFLMQSTASNESTAYSSDCLETSNAEPPNKIHNNEIKEFTPNKITDSVKTDQPTEAKTTYLIRATSPKPLSVIVSNEKLRIQYSPPIISQLIQDAKVQSSSTPKTLEPTNETDAVTVSTSIAEDGKPLQVIPIIEYSLPRNCTEVSTNQETSSQEEVNQTSSNNQVMNSLCKMEPNCQIHFEQVSQDQRENVLDENIASTSLGAARQYMQVTHIEKEAMQINMHGEQSSRGHYAEPENEDVTNIESNPQYCCSSSTTHQEAASEQAETYQPIANNNEALNLKINLKTKTPNCNRYFTPFYLQRPVFLGAEATPSSPTVSRPSAEQQQLMHVRDAQQSPSSSTQEITNISVRFYQSSTAMEASETNLQYSNDQANNNQIGASQQTLSHSPAHASENNNQTQPGSSKSNTRTSRAKPKETRRSDTGLGRPTASNSNNSPFYSPPYPNHTQPSSRSNTRTARAAPKETPRPDTNFGRSTTPNFNNNNAYYNPFYPPSAFGSSANQYRFPPFPAIQQQNIHSQYSHNVPNTYNFKQSPFSHPPIANPNMYGYSPRNEPSYPIGNPQQPFNGQPNYPYLQSFQQSSTNQTEFRPEYNQYSSNNYSQNIQQPNLVNNDNIRHHSNIQNPFWGQNKTAIDSPSHLQPPLEQSAIDPNKWINDRFQQTMRPNYNNNNDKNNWLSRPQESNAPISTNPVDMNAWMRARTQQVMAKPPELTTEQRIAQLEAVVSSFNTFVHNFQGFNSSLVGTGVGTGAVRQPAPSVAVQTSPPWQPNNIVANNSPTMGNMATQSVPDARNAWAEYNNLMNVMQMEGNKGNQMSMNRNPSVNQYPVPQNISHQINAADSTTGGQSNPCHDLRSFRKTHPQYNQSQPYDTYESSYENQYNMLFKN